MTVYEKGPENNPGVWTDRRRKEQYALSMDNMIRTGKAKIARDIVSVNRYATPEHNAGTFQRMVDQVRVYKRFSPETTDPLSTFRGGVSGVADKYGKKNASARDDLAFTLSMCMGICDKIVQEKMPGFPNHLIE